MLGSDAEQRVYEHKSQAPAFSDVWGIKQCTEDRYKTSSHCLTNGYSISVVMISRICILLCGSVTTQGKTVIKTYLIKFESTVIRKENCGIGKRHTD